MLNKDKGKDISKASEPVRFDTVIRKTAPPNDIRLHDEMTGMWDGGWLMIELLGKFKTEENYEFILSHVNDPIVVIRSNAIKALGGFKSHAKQLLPLLEGIISSDEIQGIKETAKNSRKKLVHYGEKHPEVLV